MIHRATVGCKRLLGPLWIDKGEREPSNAYRRISEPTACYHHADEELRGTSAPKVKAACRKLLLLRHH